MRDWIDADITAMKSSKFEQKRVCERQWFFFVKPNIFVLQTFSLANESPFLLLQPAKNASEEGKGALRGNNYCLRASDKKNCSPIICVKKVIILTAGQNL